MSFFESDSITFHYLDIGQELPFVFQHGMGGDVQQTKGTFQTPIPFRLLTMDCRGHGKTSPLGDPALLNFNQFGDDLLAFLDHLQIERTAMGGISMGAGVALNFAMRYPDRVSALVLVRPAWLNESLPANLQVYPRIGKLIRSHGVNRACEIFKQTEEYLKILQTYPATAASLEKQFARPDALEYIAILERMPMDAPNHNPDHWSLIDIPTLILANECDPVHPFHYGEVLHQSIQSSYLEQITSKEIDARQHSQDIQTAIECFFRQSYEK